MLIMWHMRMRRVPIRDLLFEQPHDLRRILGRDRDLELLHHDPLAALALLEGRDHAPVVLGGRDDFVAALEVVAVLQDLEALRRVARDRDLLGVHVPLPGEAGADALPLRLQDLPPVVDRDLVGEVEVPASSPRGTWAGVGLTPPLLRLTRERSVVKAFWISSQNSSSRAISSAEPGVREASARRGDGGVPLRRNHGHGSRGCGGAPEAGEESSAGGHAASWLVRRGRRLHYCCQIDGFRRREQVRNRLSRARGPPAPPVNPAS